LATLLLTYPSGRAGPGINGLAAKGLLVVATLFCLADLLTRQTTGGPCQRGCTDQPNPFLVVDLGQTVANISVLAVGITGLIVLAW
jgi:hypothetical protein